MSAKTCNISETVQGYYTVIRSPFQCSVSPKCVTLNDLERDSSCFVLALAAPDAHASTRLPCLAYINVPLSAYCKTR